GKARTPGPTTAWAGTATAAGTNSTAARAASMRKKRFIGETPLLFVGGSTQRNRRSWRRAVPPAVPHTIMVFLNCIKPHLYRPMLGLPPFDVQPANAWSWGGLRPG